MYVIKLGGSAITDKTRPYTYRRGKVAKVAQVLGGRPAALIHGGGSFAHPHVRAFGLTGLGIALTKAALRRLTAYVVEELAEGGAAAMPIEPSEVFWGGRLTRPEVITHATSHGLYPLLHGDIVPTDGGYMVLSGDDIAVELAKALRPKAAVFLMEVDGIYTEPPGSPNAVKIRKISGEISIEGAGGVDITGGIKKKVAAGLDIAKLGVPVFYCSIDDRMSLGAILAGRETEGCSQVIP
ncbi:MAG: isopentenyl phosphate kinase [Pyrobaculum sp.]